MNDMTPQIIKNMRRINFEIDPALKAEFLEALRADDMNQRRFFTPLIKEYILKRKKNKH